MFVKLIALVALGSCQFSYAGQLLPRATSTLNNSTSTKSAPSPTSSLLCCYLESFDVRQIIWYSSSLEVTVATVSTIVYQYNNTAITSYSTRFVNNTLPTGDIVRENGQTISGVPTDIIGLEVGGYNAATTIVTGTVFTDPYGVQYTSPTPVWYYSYITYRTASSTLSDSAYVCPSYSVGFDGGDQLRPYPSGYFSVDPDPKYGRDGNGELFTILPTGLRDWMATHTPPQATAPWNNVGGCTMGFGGGIPTAHVPVNALTGSALTTTTIKGNFGSEVLSTTPISIVVPPPTTQIPPPASTTPVASPPYSTDVVAPPPPSSNAGVTPGSSSAAGESSSFTPSPLPPTSAVAPGQSSPAVDGSSSAAGPQPSTSVVVPTQPTSAAGQSLSVAPNPQSPTTATYVPGSTPPGSVPTQSPSLATLSDTGLAPGSTANSAVNPPTSDNLGQSPTSISISGGSSTLFAPGSTPPLDTVAGNPSAQSNSQVTGNPIVTTAIVPPGNSQVAATTTAPYVVAPVITVEGTTIVGNSQSGFVIGSSTLTPGGTVIVPGSGTGSPTTYVLPTSGSSVIVNGVTQSIQVATVPAATTTPIIVIGSSTYTANSDGDFIIGTQVLTGGGVITQSGVTLSLATSGGTLVQASGGVTSTESVGGIIVSVGGFGTSTSTSQPVQVTGDAGGRKEATLWAMGGGMAAAILGVAAF